MTVYDLEIPDSVSVEVIRILKEESGETEFLPRYTRILAQYYLKYIRQDKAKKYTKFDTVVNKFCSCPKCVNEVWAYWRKRLTIAQNELNDVHRREV